MENKKIVIISPDPKELEKPKEPKKPTPKPETPLYGEATKSSNKDKNKKSNSRKIN